MTLNRYLSNSALAIAGASTVFGFNAAAQAASIVSNFGFIPLGTTTVVPTNSPLNLATSINLIGSPNIINSIIANPGGLTLGSNLTINPSTINLTTLSNTPTNVSFPDFLKFGPSDRYVFGIGQAKLNSVTTADALNLSFAGTVTDATGVLSPTPAVATFAINRVESGGQISYNYSGNFVSPSGSTPATPEPSAVLGLLALGLCGTLLGRKKD